MKKLFLFTVICASSLSYAWQNFNEWHSCPDFLMTNGNLEQTLFIETISALEQNGVYQIVCSYKNMQSNKSTLLFSWVRKLDGNWEMAGFKQNKKCATPENPSTCTFSFQK